MNKKTLGFQLRQIKRAIERANENYVFKQVAKNKFNEPDPDKPPVEVTLQGIYHEQMGYATTNTGDAGSIHRTPESRIFCLWEDGCKIQKDNKIDINTSHYEVSAVYNVNNLGIVAEISLREVQ